MTLWRIGLLNSHWIQKFIVCSLFLSLAGCEVHESNPRGYVISQTHEASQEDPIESIQP